MSNTAIRTNKGSYYFSIIKQAIAGVKMDYTTGSIRRAVIMLAIPMILEMCMESVFALVDIFFVNRWVGNDGATAVGLTESVITIVYSLAIGISMAATAMVARRIGEKNPDAAAKAAMQSMWVAVIITAVISVSGFIFAPDILRLMKAQPDVIAIGVNYTRIMMGGSVVIMLLFLINGIFRGAGDASMAMKSLWLANICNIILCPVLIHTYGLQGAAMATTIGRGVGVLFQLYHLFKGKRVITIERKHYAFDWPIVKSLVKIASPGTFQFIIASCSWIFLARLVSETGHKEASAGYQTAIRILIFFILPAWGLSNAAATLVGQNLGAKQPQRAEESVYKTAKYNAIFMAIVTILFLVAAKWILSFFIQEPIAREQGIRALRIMSSGYIFYGIAMVMTTAFNGAGDTWTPTIINFFGFWLFQIPLAYILAKTFDLGPTGAYLAVPISETAIAVAAFIIFKRGRWKKIQI
ncbi:MAG: MATE family efflux transporter [Ferruginibacter sp.]